MLEIKLNQSGIILALPAIDGNEQAMLTIGDGSQSDKELEIRNRLIGSTGAFGHTINPERVTPLDLHAALVSLGYSFQVLQGAEMVAEYDPKIPEGAVT
jgi:hypothetical protein